MHCPAMTRCCNCSNIAFEIVSRCVVNVCVMLYVIFFRWRVYCPARKCSLTFTLRELVLPWTARALLASCWLSHSKLCRVGRTCMRIHSSSVVHFKCFAMPRRLHSQPSLFKLYIVRWLELPHKVLCLSTDSNGGSILSLALHGKSVYVWLYL